MGCSFEQFLQNYSDFDRSLLFSHRGVRKSSDWYPASILETFSFRREKMINEGRLLLDILALLNPGGVLLSLFDCNPSEMQVEPALFHVSHISAYIGNQVMEWP